MTCNAAYETACMDGGQSSPNLPFLKHTHTLTHVHAHTHAHTHTHNMSILTPRDRGS